MMCAVCMCMCGDVEYCGHTIHVESIEIKVGQYSIQDNASYF